MAYLRQAVVGLAMAMVLTGCASSNYIKDEDATKIYNVSVDEMFVLIPQAVDLAGMKVKAVDRANNVIIANSPPSFWTSSLANMVSGGDEVTVRIKEIQVTQTSVFIRVVATANAMDMGRSARVARALFKQLDTIVQQKISSSAAA